MADDKKPEAELGIDFGDVEEPDTPPKPSAKVYETANKHLAPSDVPGKPEDNVFNVTRAFDEDAVEMGTIVSDRKRKRTPLGKTLKSAFTEWWGKTRKSFDSGVHIIEDTLEKEVEPEVKTRTQNKDRSKIVEKAKEKTVQPPENDHEVILEKSKTFQKDAARAKGVPFVVKKEEPPTPTWQTKNDVPKPKKVVEEKKINTPIESPDLRHSMVAPAVNKRTEEKINSYKVPGTSEKEKNEKPTQKNNIVSQKPSKKIVSRKLPPIKPRVTKKPSSPIFIAPKVTTHSSFTQKKDGDSIVSHTEEKQQTKPVPQPPTNPQSQPAPKPEKVVSQKTQGQKPEKLGASSILQEQVPQKIKTAHSHVRPTTHTITPPEHDVEMHIQEVDLPKKTKQHDGKKQTLLIWAVVIIIILVLGTTLVLWLTRQQDAPDTDPVSQQAETVITMPAYVPSFLDVDIQTPIPFTGDKQSFLSSLSEAASVVSSGVTQFYPIRESETDVSLVNTWDIFTALETKLPTRVIRSLDTVSMFGTVTTDQPEPFMLLRSYNFDYLFAGMLDWEPYMYDDLRPFFGAKELPSLIFMDTVKNNVPVRVLYENENEVLLYAFLNRDTVVITTSLSALTAIIERF